SARGSSFLPPDERLPDDERIRRGESLLAHRFVSASSRAPAAGVAQIRRPAVAIISVHVEGRGMNYGALDACVRWFRGDMIDFTSELVAIGSENPPGARYPECVQAIASRLRALDMPCEIVPYRPARSAKGRKDDSGAAVVLSHVGNGTRTLYFSGHYDVVPETTPGQAAPVRKGRLIFGRGSADMKGGLAAMLYAAVALKRLDVPLAGRVGLVFVPDEETGGQRGSGYLAATKRLGANGIGMLTPEPTSGVIWNANRGAI